MILTKSKNFSITISDLLDSEKLSDEIESVLIIVPTNRKLRVLKKQIIDKFTGSPVTRINIETFTTFSTKLLRSIRPFSTLSEAASTVLIKQASNELKLKYFSAYSNGIPFGTLDKIKNVISEYKRNGITPGKLLEESENLESGEKFKAEDLTLIYKSYLAKCKKLSALELGDIYLELTELKQKEFSETFGTIYTDVKSILIDGFDEFTSLEISLIEKLSEAVNSKISINFDYFGNNDKLFSHLSQTYFRLTQLGFSEKTNTNSNENISFKKKLRSELFNKVEKKDCDFKDKIFKISAKNRIDEIETIAKIIKELILKENVNPENICVVFNIIGNYSSKVRDIFKKYGLPLNLTDRIPLKSSPPVIAAISLLELIESDYHYDDIARVVTNGFLQFINIDLNNLLHVASELKITVGKNNWEQVVSDNIQLIKFRENLTEDDVNKKLKNYKKALSDIYEIDKILSPLKKKNTISDFLQNFTNVLLNLKLPCIVLEDSNNREEEHIKAVTVLIKTLRDVLFLVQKDEKNVDKKYPLDFYLDQIRTISNWARFNVKEKSDYGILVTSLNEIRGLTFDCLFLGGMCDGDFPTKYSPEIFFSGSFRKQEIIHQTEEKYHFYQTLCVWNKSLFLSVPKNDKDSELVESTFLKDFKDVFELTEYQNGEVNKIYSKEELLKEYGNNLKNVELSQQIRKANFKTEDILEKNKIRDLRKENYLLSNSYNGFIGSEDENISTFLNKFSEREFSISQFETFAKCPFKYFSERILKIKPFEEPTEEAEPLELGSVLHSVLYEFYSKVSEEKITIGKVGTNEFKNLKDLLFEIAEKKISDLNLNSPLTFFEKEKILGIEGNKKLSILYKFLLEETEEKSEFIPKFFEYSFGNIPNRNNSNSEVPLEIDNLKLKGTVDRIDVDERNSFFNIVDYKLKGKKPTIKELYEGLSLQLPVYLMAGKQILKEEKGEDFEGQDMIIYSLNFKEEKFGKSKVNLKFRGKLNSGEKIDLNNQLLETTKSKLLEYHSKIKKGNFHLSSLENREEKVCKYCDFRVFCRVKEVFE